jgi:hypothetical protein
LDRVKIFTDQQSSLSGTQGPSRREAISGGIGIITQAHSAQVKRLHPSIPDLDKLAGTIVSDRVC